MRIDDATIKKIFEQGQTAQIDPAVKLQSWLQGHFNTSKDGQKVVRDRVRALGDALLPEDKVTLLMSILESPFKSTELLGEAYEKLQSVTNPRNASESWNGKEGSIAEMKEWLSDNKIIEKFRLKQFELFKWAPNSLIVVDSKENSKGEVDEKGNIKAEAYIAYVDVSKLYQFELEEDGIHFKWAIFRESEDKFLIYTDEVYAVYYRPTSNSDYVHEEISKHNIGYCPVLFMMQEKGEANNPVLKKTQVLNQLPILDKYILSDLGFYNQKTTSIWSILVVPESKCNYEKREEGANNQFITTTCVGGLLFTDGQPTGAKCPACSGKALAGAGAIIQKPIPHEGQPDMSNPVEIVAPQIADVEFTAEDLVNTENRFMVAVTGKGSSSILATQPVNKDQVAANKEGQETILSNIAKQFGFCESWAVNTLVRLQFQTTNNTYTRNGGSEFFTRTELELVELIGIAKEVSAQPWYIQNLNKELEELVNKNNPIAKKRQDILNAVEPFPALTIEEATQVSGEIALKKLVFDEFVRDYELNNTSVGEYKDYKSHITRLKKELDKFSKNYGKANEEQAGSDSRDESAENTNQNND